MTADANSATPPTRVLWAIGTANYTDPAYQESGPLSQSVPRSLTAVVEAFRRSRVETKFPEGFLLNPSTERLRDILAEAGDAGDIVIIYYTGHGEAFGRDGYHLITTDFEKSKRWKTGLKAADLPGLVSKRRDDGEIDPQQPSILLILDCCFSGAGGLEVLKEAVLGGPDPNLWVWATAGKTQYATSGVFAQELAEVLRRPPVGLSSGHIPLDTVLDVIERALEGTDQRAEMFIPPAISTFPQFFPNPEYVPQVAGRTVAEQHWISKARGGPETADIGAGFYLTGRTGRVNAAVDLAHWITDQEAGNLAVLTGSPGTGKSALLSLPALLTNPAGRELLLTNTPQGSLAHQIADVLPVQADVLAIHARGLNTDQVAQPIALRLGRSAASGLALLESLDEDPPQRHPVVIVDALDEASSPSRLRDSLLVSLAAQYGLRIVIGARRHVLPPQPATVIDLDTDTYRDPQALIDYIHQLLVAALERGVHTPYQGIDATTTDRVAAAIAERATARPSHTNTLIAESFLIARVIALAVRARPEPIDTTTNAWKRTLPDGLKEAFEEDLTRLGEHTPAARVLLEATAWARGPGLPWETIWVPVAQALASLHGDVELSKKISDDDVRWLLQRAGAYLVEDLGPGGRSVFRPFHDRMAEYLRALSGTTHDDTARVEAAVTAALLDTLGPIGARRWDRAHPYLRTYLSAHALAARPDVFSTLLKDNGFLAAANPSTLTPLLAQAPPERGAIVRAYRRARPLLSENPAANAAYLQEAALAVTETRLSFAGTAISPTYHTKWTRVRPDQSLLTLACRTGTVRSVALGTGAGGRPLLASGSDDGTVQLWDPDTGEQIGQPLTGHTGGVYSVAFGTGAGGRPLLASGSDDGTVRLWDPDTGEQIGQPLTGHIGAVRSVAFGTGAGGRPLLASAGNYRGTVRLWDPDTGERIGQPLTLSQSLTSVVSVAFGTGAGGRPLLASGRDDGTVQLWDPDTGEQIGQPLTRHTRGVYSVAFGTGAGGRPLLASGSDDGTVRLWDPDTGEQIGQPLTGHTRGVYSVAFGTEAGGQPLLASAGFDRGYDHTVRLWDPDTGEQIGQPLTGHTGAVRSVAFGTGAGGRPLLASAGHDGTVQLWDPDTSEQVGQPLTGHTRGVDSVAFGTGAGGQPLLASAGFDRGFDRTVRLWDPDTGEQIGQPLTGHTGAVRSMAFGTGAGGRPLLASAGDDGTVQLWDPDTGEQIGQPLTGHTDRVNSVAFSPDGHLLASAGDDGTVQLWDPDTGEQIGQPLTGHTDRVNSVAFGTGAGGQPLLASGSDDGTVQLWDPDTGVLVMTIRRRADTRALASDGSRFAIGGEEGLSVIEIS